MRATASRLRMCQVWHAGVATSCASSQCLTAVCCHRALCDPGRYDGMWQEEFLHGFGIYSNPHGWAYSGLLERDQPTVGVLTEVDGRSFDVSYAKTCAAITENPTPLTKVCDVGIFCCELRALQTSSRAPDTRFRKTYMLCFHACVRLRSWHRWSV